MSGLSTKYFISKIWTSFQAIRGLMLILIVSGTSIVLFVLHGVGVLSSNHLLSVFLIGIAIAFLSILLTPTGSLDLDSHNILFLLFILGAGLVVSVHTEDGTSGTRGLKIEYAFDELNETDEFIQSVKAKDDFIKVTGKNCSTYQISMKDKDKPIHTQPFELMSYTRTSGEMASSDADAWGKVCSKADSLDKPFPLSEFITNLDKGDYAKFFGNLFTLLFEQKSKDSTVGIFIRGSADAQKREWSRPLDKNHHYRTAIYYKSNNIFDNSYNIRETNIAVHHIPSSSTIKHGHYGNEDLPYLRAMFAYENYFKGFLRGCIPQRSHGGILEGVLSSTENPIMRKTEIFATICYDG